MVVPSNHTFVDNPIPGNLKVTVLGWMATGVNTWAKGSVMTVEFDGFEEEDISGSQVT